MSTNKLNVNATQLRRHEDKTPDAFNFKIIFFAFPLVLGISQVRAADQPPAVADIKIILDRSSTGNQHSSFVVTGLSSSQLSSLPRISGLKRLFAVNVVTEKDAGNVPLFGDYRVDKDRIVFEPRFPLQPGLKYRASFHPEQLTAEQNAVRSAKPVERFFTIPAAEPKAPTQVTQVFPSRDWLPENQLKFYIHFSAPMSRGEAYRHIRLIKSSGKEVKYPFFQLDQELWDPSGTRFTLFFDPGRIKHGLRPREEVGPSLEQGKSYTLVVDHNWSDATGRPLKQSFRKKFKAIAPDESQPNPDQWKLQAPTFGSNDPFTIQFNEPLDHGMLQGILVVDANDEIVAGKILIDQYETCWRFHPTKPWLAGNYSLVVDTRLEDLAGNTIAFPFEVDVFQKVEQKTTTNTIRLPFSVQ